MTTAAAAAGTVDWYEGVLARARRTVYTGAGRSLHVHINRLLAQASSHYSQPLRGAGPTVLYVINECQLSRCTADDT